METAALFTVAAVRGVRVGCVLHALWNQERKSKGYEARTMPVPRSLSSSCGTCVKYTAPEPLYDPDHDEMEQMVVCNDDGSYTQIYLAEGLAK